MPTNQTNTTSTSDKTTETTTQRSPQTYGGGILGSGDLAGALLNIMTQQAGALRTVNQSRQEAVAAQQQALDAQVAAQRVVASQIGEVARQRAETTYAQNSLLERHQRDFGMDPDQVNNEILKNLAIRNALEPQLEAARREYDAATSIGLLDNPIGFLFAQLKLPQLAAKNNAIADSIARADHNIAQRTALLNGVKQTVTANNADAIRKHQLAQAEIDAKIAEANLHAAEAANRGALAAARMQDIQVINMMGDNQRQTLVGVAQLKDQEEQRVYRREQQELLRMQRQDILDKRRADAESDARMDARFKMISDSLGLAEPMTVQRMRTLHPDNQKAWVDAALNGQYGEDLLESIKFFRPLASRNGMFQNGSSLVYDTGMKLEKAGVSKEGEAVLEYRRMNAGKEPKREDALKLGFRMYQDGVVSSAMGPKHPQDLSSPKWDKEFNPYRVPMLAFTGAVRTDAKLAPLRNNLVVKMATELATASGTTGTDLSADQQQQLFGAIREQVRTGKLPAKQAAAHIAEYVRAGTEWNRKTTGYTLFGLPPQTAYLFTFHGSFMGADSKKVDLMNPAELERALTLDAVKSKQIWGETPFGFR